MTSLTAIIIESTKAEELAEFYRQGFDLSEPEWAAEDHLGFQVGATYLGFDQVKVNAGPSRRASIWFHVDDMTAVFARLVKLGATVEYVPTISEGPGEILAKLFDPEGNSIGLLATIK